MNKPTNDAIDELCNQWKTECPELDTSAMQVVGRVLHLGNRFEADANRTLKKYDLKYTDFDIIATLRRSGKPYRLTPTELCRSVILTSGAMTTALDRLERKGLIARIQDTADKRVHLACLTAAGITLAETVAVDRFNLAHSELSSLTAEEKQQLGALLKKL